MKDFVRRYPVASALLLFFAASIPMMILRDWSPSNELRYLSIADEAIANGKLFAFSNHGAAYADKPPLFLWLVMLCRLVAGSHCSLLLESLLCWVPAAVTVVVLDRWLCDIAPEKMDARKRGAAALLTLTSVLFMGCALALRMDMLMTMFIVLSLRSFHKWYMAEVDGSSYKGKERWLMPLWIFMALFTKGPVGLLMPLAGIAVFLVIEGRWRRTGHYLGIRTWGVIAALSALWLTGVYLDGGPEYLNNLLFHQTIDRAVSAFDHKKPFWFYLLYVWVVLFPFSPVLICAWVQSFRIRNNRSSAERLMAVASVMTFVMLSCFSSKLFIYLLPICPLITAMYPLVHDRMSWKWDWTKPVFIVAGVMAAGILVASPFMNGINAKSSYGGFCKVIPADEEVSTLFIKRAENIDVYLGREVEVYDTEEEFLDGWTGGVLAVKISALESKGSESLKARLDTLGHRDVGAFRVFDPVH